MFKLSLLPSLLKQYVALFRHVEHARASYAQSKSDVAEAQKNGEKVWVLIERMWKDDGRM